MFYQNLRIVGEIFRNEIPVKTRLTPEATLDRLLKRGKPGPMGGLPLTCDKVIENLINVSCQGLPPPTLKMHARSFFLPTRSADACLRFETEIPPLFTRLSVLSPCPFACSFCTIRQKETLTKQGGELNFLSGRKPAPIVLRMMLMECGLRQRGENDWHAEKTECGK
jgi:hypothetical protein